MSNAQNLAGQRFALIANFPPDIGPSERHSSGLAHMLCGAGAEVITASEVGHSYARIPLIYRTRRLFAATRNSLQEAIKDSTQLVIYASALKTDNIEKPYWKNRRMEEWRRFHLALTAAQNAQKCQIVFDIDWRQKPFWISLALVTALTPVMPVRVVSLRRGPSWLLNRITGISASEPSDETSVDTTYELALNDRNISEKRLTPIELGQISAKLNDKILQDALEEIRRISSEIRRDCQHFAVLRGNLAREKIDKITQANAILPSGLSRFMEHYRATLRPSGSLPLGAKTDDAAFLDWYLHSTQARRKSSILPVPNHLIPADSNTLGVARTVVKFAHRVEKLDFLSSEHLRFFAGHISENNFNLSRMELILATALEQQITAREMAEAPWCAAEIRTWFADIICSIAPSMRVFSTAPTKILTAAPSVEIAGIVDGESGLAKNTLMSARAFQSLGLTANIRHSSDLANPRALAPHPPVKGLARSVILHHVNADQIPQQVAARALAIGNNSLHIGYLLWELNHIPESHRMAGELLDDIWAPTRFVQQIYQNAYGREVINIGKEISLPNVQAADLRAYGIGHEQVFLVCFDANSSVERKNPLAAVRAFQAAFPSDNSVRLIVKTTPTGRNNWGDPHQQMRAIRRFARKDSRVILIEENLPFAALISLIKRADCILSTHRAEGFGYIPAYGLKFAKPVIVTDHSGTQDFCNDATAFPVACDLVTPQLGETIAPVKGAVWADIDVSELANSMREVFENPDEAHRRGRAGQRLMQSYYSPEAHAARYLKRLQELGAVT